MLRDREKKNARARQYYLEHKDEKRIKGHEYWENNKDIINARHKKYQKEHPDVFQKAQRKYRERHREERNAEARQFRKDNPGYHREATLKYRRTNPNYRPSARKHSLKYRDNHPVEYWVRGTLSHHRAKGHDVQLDLKALVAIAEKSKTCFYCDVPLDYSAGKGRPHSNSPSLDRRDNELILNAENVNIICHLCNTTKGARTHEAFMDYCAKIVKKQRPSKTTPKQFAVSGELFHVSEFDLDSYRPS